MINHEFSEKEIRDGICKLKNNKACGYDGIVNEFIKDAADVIAPVITKLVISFLMLVLFLISGVLV